MLNKDVCRRCQLRNGKNVNMRVWNKLDDDLWSFDKEVICPITAYPESIFKRGDIRTIPDHCLYKFEQSVAAGMKNG